MFLWKTNFCLVLEVGQLELPGTQAVQKLAKVLAVNPDIKVFD